MSFRIIHELETLSEEQRKQYAADASVYFGLDPELGGLDFIWMNQDSGFRKLVLYARRGITDILRDKRKINVTAVTQQPINGSLVTTATGQDGTGRREIAVGSMYIEGLRERALDDAIMTSQTRALRRLTLQFVGGGILDESEVGGVTVHSAGGGVSPTLQPSVAPSNAPGKDITEKTGESISEPRETWKKRIRKNKEVDLGPSELPLGSAETSAKQPAKQPAISATPVAVTLATPVVTPEIKSDILPDIQPAQTPARTPPKKKLSAEEVKPYKQRLFQLLHMLEKPVHEGGAGFEPKLGVGNSEKMKLFAVKRYGVNMAEFTTAKWGEFLTELEDYHAETGSLALANYIEGTVL